MDSVGDLVVSGVGAVADGAGILGGAGAPLGEGPARFGLTAFVAGAAHGEHGHGETQDDAQDQQAEDDLGGRVEGLERGDHSISPLALAVWTLRSSSPFVPPLIARVRPSRSSASALAFRLRSDQ